MHNKNPGANLALKSNRIKENTQVTPAELQTFMNFHGLGSRELSEIFGVTEGAVRFWQSGDRPISVTNSRLIRLFNKFPHLLTEF